MITNGQTPRTHGCITLAASGNRHGSLELFDLKSGKVVTGRGFQVIPMPDRFVKLVNDLGMRSKKENRKTIWNSQTAAGRSLIGKMKSLTMKRKSKHSIRI